MTKTSNIEAIAKIRNFIEPMLREQKTESELKHLYLLFGEASSLLQNISELSDEAIASDKKLLERKHKFVVMLLLNPNTLDFARFAVQNLFADPIHPDFIVHGYDINNPNARGVMFDLLSYILFLRKTILLPVTEEFNKHMTSVAKLLIEHGDIMYSANFAVHNSSGFTMLEFCDFEPQRYHEFYSVLKNFYVTLSPDVRDYLFGLGLERGIMGRKFTCSISHNFPTIPVRLDRKLYDLIILADKLQVQMGRNTPYKFIFNDKEVDSREIEFDQQYFVDLKHWINNVLVYTAPLELACALSSYNFYRLCWVIFSSSLTARAFYLLFDDDLSQELNKDKKLGVLSLFCFHNMMQAAFLAKNKISLLDKITQHPNHYIRNLLKFNNAYAWPVFGAAMFGMLFLSWYASQIKRHPDDPQYNYLPTKYIADNFVSLCFTPYLLAYMTYMLSSIMQTKLYSFRQIASQPIMAVDKQACNAESKRQILFNFEHFSKTDNMSDFATNQADVDVEQGLGLKNTFS